MSTIKTRKKVLPTTISISMKTPRTRKILFPLSTEVVSNSPKESENDSESSKKPIKRKIRRTQNSFYLKQEIDGETQRPLSMQCSSTTKKTFKRTCKQNVALENSSDDDYVGEKTKCRKVSSKTSVTKRLPKIQLDDFGDAVPSHEVLVNHNSSKKGLQVPIYIPNEVDHIVEDHEEPGTDQKQVKATKKINNEEKKSAAESKQYVETPGAGIRSSRRLKKNIKYSECSDQEQEFRNNKENVLSVQTEKIESKYRRSQRKLIDRKSVGDISLPSILSRKSSLHNRNLDLESPIKFGEEKSPESSTGTHKDQFSPVSEPLLDIANEYRSFHAEMDFNEDKCDSAMKDLKLKSILKSNKKGKKQSMPDKRNTQIEKSIADFVAIEPQGKCSTTIRNRKSIGRVEPTEQFSEIQTNQEIVNNCNPHVESSDSEVEFNFRSENSMPAVSDFDVDIQNIQNTDGKRNSLKSRVNTKRNSKNDALFDKVGPHSNNIDKAAEISDMNSTAKMCNTNSVKRGKSMTIINRERSDLIEVPATSSTESPKRSGYASAVSPKSPEIFDEIQMKKEIESSDSEIEFNSCHENSLKNVSDFDFDSENIQNASAKKDNFKSKGNTKRKSKNGISLVKIESQSDNQVIENSDMDLKLREIKSNKGNRRSVWDKPSTPIINGKRAVSIKTPASSYSTNGSITSPASSKSSLKIETKQEIESSDSEIEFNLCHENSTASDFDIDIQNYKEIEESTKRNNDIDNTFSKTGSDSSSIPDNNENFAEIPETNVSKKYDTLYLPPAEIADGKKNRKRWTILEGTARTDFKKQFGNLRTSLAPMSVQSPLKPNNQESRRSRRKQWSESINLGNNFIKTRRSRSLNDTLETSPNKSKNCAPSSSQLGISTPDLCTEDTNLPNQNVIVEGEHIDTSESLMPKGQRRWTILEGKRDFAKKQIDNSRKSLAPSQSDNLQSRRSRRKQWSESIKLGNNFINTRRSRSLNDTLETTSPNKSKNNASSSELRISTPVLCTNDTSSNLQNPCVTVKVENNDELEQLMSTSHSAKTRRSRYLNNVLESPSPNRSENIETLAEFIFENSNIGIKVEDIHALQEKQLRISTNSKRRSRSLNNELKSPSPNRSKSFRRSSQVLVHNSNNDANVEDIEALQAQSQRRPVNNKRSSRVLNTTSRCSSNISRNSSLMTSRKPSLCPEDSSMRCSLNKRRSTSLTTNLESPPRKISKSYRSTPHIRKSKPSSSTNNILNETGNLTRDATFIMEDTVNDVSIGSSQTPGSIKRRRDTYELNESVTDISILKSLSESNLSGVGVNIADTSNAVHFDNVTVRRKKATATNRKVTFSHSVDQSIFSPPSSSSTPYLSKSSLLKQVLTKDNRSTSFKRRSKSADDSSVKVSRIKMPNFSKIHQRAMDKMEDIAQMTERKAERARLLLSGQRPTENSSKSNTTQENKPGHQKTSHRQLQFDKNQPSTSKGSCNIEKDETLKYQNAKKEKFVSRLPVNENAAGPSKSGFLKIHVPHKLKRSVKIPAPKAQAQSKTNNFGFKMKTTEHKVESIKAITTKTKPTQNNLEERRTVLKGVRGNRRFELLMKMRKN